MFVSYPKKCQWSGLCSKYAGHEVAKMVRMMTFLRRDGVGGASTRILQLRFFLALTTLASLAPRARFGVTFGKGMAR